MPGRIPQNFINDLLERVDIVDVIDARLTLRKAGASRYKALCPFHDEKTPSFSVNVDDQYYYCFGCQASGTALTFLIEHDRLDFPDAVEVLAASVGLEVPRERGASSERPNEDKRLYDVLEQAASHYRSMLRSHPEAHRAVDYLKSRGLTGVIARDFGVGFAPPGWDGLMSAAQASEAELKRAGLVIENEQKRVYDRFRERIMFPIRDTRGRVIGFGGRVLGDDTPKYLNSPETPVFHKGRELYGLYEARRAVRNVDRFVVVEGYMDVVALAQAGIPYAVASLGTATSETHFDKLFRYAPEVICCFDGDKAGRDAAWKALGIALPTLKQGRQLKFMFVPEGDDPDTLVRKEGRDAFQTRLGGALSAAEYLFQHLARGLDLGAMDDRARLAELAIPLISRVPDGVLRELMMNRLAELAELPVDALYRGAGQPRARARPAQKISDARQSKLDQRLLTLLVQHPEFIAELEGDRFSALTGMTDSLVGRVVNSIVSLSGAGPQAQPDTGALLGYWSGDPGHGLLAELADRAVMLEGEALAQEFVDAVDQTISAAIRANRRAMVSGLREDASADKLAEYWKAKQAEHPTSTEPDEKTLENQPDKASETERN